MFSADFNSTSDARGHLFPHHRCDEKVKWKRKEDSRAEADAPENGHPLQVVQKTVAPIGWFAFHDQLLAGCFIASSESRGAAIGTSHDGSGSSKNYGTGAREQSTQRWPESRHVTGSINADKSFSNGDAIMKVDHTPNPRIKEREQTGPHLTTHEHVGLNGKIALVITNAVGTMWCAYAFAVIALISLPSSIQGGVSTLIAWIAQTFLQLVLLSVIMVGQKVAAAASDKQALQTYRDAEALLKIQDEVRRLIEVNNELTEAIHRAVIDKGTSTAGPLRVTGDSRPPA